VPKDLKVYKGQMEIKDLKVSRVFKDHKVMQVPLGLLVLKVLGATGPTGDKGLTGDQGVRGSRSYYTALQTSWTAAAAVAEIGTPLENDISIQYDEATKFSEGRVFTTGDPNLSTNWDIVDRAYNGIPVIENGIPTSTGIGDNNTLNLGDGAGESNQGDDCVAIGNNAGNSSQGRQSVAIGYRAGESSQGLESVAIGDGAGLTNQGIQSVAIGLSAGITNQGLGCVAIGYSAQTAAVGFGGSVAVGATAQTDDQYCTAVGSNSDAYGPQTVAVGRGAYSRGLGDVALGVSSGSYNSGGGTSGTKRTYLGFDAGSSNTVHGYSNFTCLGASSTVTGSDQVQLGDSATTTYAYGAVQNRSDGRDKSDVSDTKLGLDFIKNLRPVEFRWDYREDYKTDPSEPLDSVVKDGTKKRSRLHQGFIAQEVKGVADTLDIDFAGYQDHSLIDGEDVKSLGYEEFIAPMVKAIQEQQSIIEGLSARLEMLENA
jgi:hypothetical protein